MLNFSEMQNRKPFSPEYNATAQTDKLTVKIWEQNTHTELYIVIFKHLQVEWTSHEERQKIDTQKTHPPHQVQINKFHHLQIYIRSKIDGI